MDKKSFASGLSSQQKSRLVHGSGQWHTQVVGNLPSIMMTDGPHGLRKQADKNSGINDSARATCFPTACAVATSWNVENAATIGSCIAVEAVAEDVSVVLGPGVNIKRSPLCGRNFEYFSEDPLLAGSLGESFVSSLQSHGVGCSLKHFAVNSQETRRMTVDAIVDERALREIYLAAFERIVKNSRPYTIMAAYNKLNGVSCTQNKKLLTDILRNEWGFDGLVMSDWGACYKPVEAIAAGMDLEMPDGGKYHENIVCKATQNGKLKAEHINRACDNVAKLVERCSVEKSLQLVDFQRHHEICRKIAADCAVLLKNDEEILPIKSKSIAVIGELAAKPRFQGAGSSHINAICKSFVEVLDEQAVAYDYAKGYSVFGDEIDEQAELEAVELAKKHDVVLFFGGLTDSFEGEGYDRNHLRIPDCQQRLLAKVAAVNSNVVFVAVGGSPFEMPWLNNVKALLNMYLGGEAVNEACFDVLFGTVAPSGRLAETYPQKLSDAPCFKYFANDRFTDEHRESIFVGYRYYNTFNVPVLFPFGYGLSYAKFDYSDMSVVRADNGFEVSVTVTNVSDIDGAEVTELFVDNCDCGLIRAKRELGAFCKTYLAAGESKRIVLHLDERVFSVWKDSKFVVVNGQYTLNVCKDVNTVIVSVVADVDFGEDVVGNDRLLYPDYFVRGTDGFSVRDEQFYALCGMQKQTHATPKRGEFTMLSTFEDMADSVGIVKLLAKVVKKVARNSSPTKRDDDPVARMIASGAMETPLVSMISMAGIPANVAWFLLYHANKHPWKAFCALFGKVPDAEE